MGLGLKILGCVVGGGISIAVLVALFKSKKPIRSLFASAIQGVCVLAAVNISGAFTGVSLGLNLFSGISSVVLGVPGVITMLVLKALFI